MEGTAPGARHGVGQAVGGRRDAARVPLALRCDHGAPRGLEERRGADFVGRDHGDLRRRIR